MMKTEIPEQQNPLGNQPKNIKFFKVNEYDSDI